MAAVVGREELGPTGVGRGVAVSHATPPELGRLVVGIARFLGKVGFDSIDGRPVEVVCLCLTPPGDRLFR